MAKLKNFLLMIFFEEDEQKIQPISKIKKYSLHHQWNKGPMGVTGITAFPLPQPSIFFSSSRTALLVISSAHGLMNVNMATVDGYNFVATYIGLYPSRPAMSATMRWLPKAHRPKNT